ncbi:MAG TPA: WD40 repeat domain-containing protein [Urbifossiella sp.]|nr:WD40 repeat domain-containing protein [Urbifossiella sp.]
MTAKLVLPWDQPAEFDARFSPDGTRLALAEPAERRAWLIDTGSGRTVFRQPFGNDDRPLAAAFAADGQLVAFGTDGGAVRVFDTATGDPGRVYREARARFVRVAFSPDGKRIAAADTKSAGFTGVVAWDAATGQKQRWDPLGAQYGLAFALGGRFLIRDSVLSRPSTHDTTDGELTQGVVFLGMTDTSLVVHPDGKTVAFGTASGPIGVFDVATGRPTPASADPPRPVQRLRFTPDGKTLYGWAADWYAWDVATGKQTRVTSAGWNYGVPLSPDGRFTAASERYPGDPGATTRFEVRDAKTGGLVHSHPAHEFRMAWHNFGAAFTPDGAGILGIAGEGEVKVWDFASGKERQTLVGHKATPRHRAFSPDGTALVTATWDEPVEEFPVRVWDLATGKEKARFNPGRLVAGVAVSRAGGRVAALASTDPQQLVMVVDVARAAQFGKMKKEDPERHRATVWDTATGKVLARVPQGGDGGCLALSPDGTLVAVGPWWKGEVWVYAVDGGAERFVFRHAGAVTDLAFAPDGRTLAVASQGVPVTLWDVTGGKR